MRRGVESVLEPGNPCIGKACTACRQELREGERAVVCPRCRSPHHSACWTGHGGCARPGCRQLAQSALRPPTEAERSAAASAGPRRSRLVLGVSALVAAAVSFAFVPLWRHRGPATPPAAVRLMAWASAGEAGRLQAAIDVFNRSHPDNPARLEITPYLAYEQKLIILMAAGDPPDLFMLAADRVALYASQGALLDLAPVVRQLPEFSRETLRPEDLQAFRDGERIWGLPYPLSGDALAVVASTRHPRLAVELALHLLRELRESGPAAADAP